MKISVIGTAFIGSTLVRALSAAGGMRSPPNPGIRMAKSRQVHMHMSERLMKPYSMRVVDRACATPVGRSHALSRRSQRSNPDTGQALREEDSWRRRAREALRLMRLPQS